MNEYKEVRVIYDPEDYEEVNKELRGDWVVIGIEQRRIPSSDGGFYDKTNYILGNKCMD